MFFDPVYLIFALPGLLLALWASFYTKSTFARYSRVRASSGMTGAEAAERILSAAGVSGGRVEHVGGFLSDHYDPTARVLRLSDEVYGSDSLSAIGVACHEAGHAIQHAHAYGPLGLRTALVPLTNFASPMSYIFILLGFLMHSQQMILLGAVVFSAAVLFALVTLPVEYDASRRAKLLMVESGIVTAREGRSAGDVLNAALMTYVAAAVSALLTVVYYLVRAGGFRSRG
ncbi:MAG: zinc metallopeptidase [Victivallaceae bacterium]|nr:zinc metallopeptidase [Victivallaceae bacterium]